MSVYFPEDFELTERINELESRIAELESENERLKTHELLWRDTLRENTELRKANQWHPASEPPPSGKTILAAYKNSYGKNRIVRAEYHAQFSLNAYDMDYWDDDDLNYNEKDDTYYCPEGYYESNENDDVVWKISETVTHWRELPPMPENKGEEK